MQKFNFSTKTISGTLTVNVSVLLLSLASPDESSLVSYSLKDLYIYD